MNRWATFGVAVLGMALVGGCSHMHKNPTIKEEWLARVPPAQMAPVDDARAAQRTAMNEANRADAALTDAKNQTKVAKSEKETADSRVSTAEAEVKAAKDTGNAERLQKAQAIHDHAKAGQKAAEAKVNLAEANEKAASTRKDIADARVNTREAELKMAEYQVLQQNGDTRVQKMHPAEFEATVQRRRADEAKLRDRLAKEEQQVTDARKKWNEARNVASQPSQQPTG